MKKLEGYKTYIVGVGLICFGVGGAVAGKLTVMAGAQQALIGLGMMGLRHGITTKIAELVAQKNN